MIIAPAAVPAGAPGATTDAGDGTDPATADVFAALMAGFMAPVVATDQALPTVDGAVAAVVAAPIAPTAEGLVPFAAIDASAVQAGSFVPLTPEAPELAMPLPAGPEVPAQLSVTTAPTLPVASVATPAVEIVAAPVVAAAAPVQTNSVSDTPVLADDAPVRIAAPLAPVAQSEVVVDAPVAATPVTPEVDTELAAVTPLQPVEHDAPVAPAGPAEARTIDVAPEAVDATVAAIGSEATTPASALAAAPVVPDVDTDIDTEVDTEVATIHTVDRSAPAPIRTEAPAGVSRTEAPAPVADVRPHQQIVSVVRPLHRQGDGSYRLNLHLRPAELGPVNLEVELHHGVVELHMRAENQHARDLLVEHLDDLRRELTEAGLTAGNLDVADGNQPRRQFGDTSASAPASAPALGADVTVAPTPASPSVSTSGATGLDARL